MLKNQVPCQVFGLDYKLYSSGKPVWSAEKFDDFFFVKQKIKIVDKTYKY